MPNFANWRAEGDAIRAARFRARLDETVTIAPFAGGHNPDGTPKYGLPVAHPARVEQRMQLVRAATGDERTSKATILLEDIPTATVQDRLTLPDGTHPPILALERPKLPRGLTYLVIYV